MVRQTSVISPIRCGNPELVNVYKFGVSSGSIKSGVVRPNRFAAACQEVNKCNEK